MRKELAAGALLALLFAAALCNTWYLKRLTGELCGNIDRSRQLLEAGDAAGAETELREAISLWSDSDGYTHIFVRHQEIDSATDAFYELLSFVESGDISGARGAYEKLRAHLESIYTMEKLTPGSIL